MKQHNRIQFKTYRNIKYFYFFIAACIFLFVSFAGSYNDLKKLYNYKAQLLEQNRNLNQKTELLKEKIYLLNTSEEVERIARESNLYIKEGETVYIIDSARDKNISGNEIE